MRLNEQFKYELSCYTWMSWLFLLKSPVLLHQSSGSSYIWPFQYRKKLPGDSRSPVIGEARRGFSEGYMHNQAEIFATVCTYRTSLERLLTGIYACRTTIQKLVSDCESTFLKDAVTEKLLVVGDNTYQRINRNQKLPDCNQRPGERKHFVTADQGNVNLNTPGEKLNCESDSKTVLSK